MLVVNAAHPSENIVLALVVIVNRDGECVYEAFVRPPADRHINQRSQNFCPVTNQQFAITICNEGTSFDDIRQKVLDILSR